MSSRKLNHLLANHLPQKSRLRGHRLLPPLQVEFRSQSKTSPLVPRGLFAPCKICKCELGTLPRKEASHLGESSGGFLRPRSRWRGMLVPTSAPQLRFSGFVSHPSIPPSPTHHINFCHSTPTSQKNKIRLPKIDFLLFSQKMLIFFFEKKAWWKKSSFSTPIFFLFWLCTGVSL